MNGIHDMGGMHGFGRIEREENEPVFHHDWERTTIALRQAAGALGKWNMDGSRHSNERIPPAQYLAASYYERWVISLEMLLVESGLVTRREIEAGKALSPPVTGVPAALKAGAVEPRIRTGRSARVNVPLPPRFAAGDQVVARNFTTTGHTRLPRYARGRRGAIDRDHGVFVFPDSNAMSGDPKPQHVYSVRFSASKLWGTQAPPRDVVFIDLWDDYLDRA